jgi:hypothetical protein
MMDSDDDDIYPQNNESNGYQAQTEDRMEDVEDGEEEGEEVEDSDVWHTPELVLRQQNIP